MSRLIGRLVIYTGTAVGTVAYLGVNGVASHVLKARDFITAALSTAAAAAPAAVPVSTNIAESLNIVKLAMNTMPWFTAAGCLYAIRKFFYDSGKVDEISENVTQIDYMVGILKGLSDEIKEKLLTVADDVSDVKVDLCTVKNGVIEVNAMVTRLQADMGLVQLGLDKLGIDVEDFRTDTEQWHKKTTEELLRLATFVTSLDKSLQTAVARVDTGMNKIQNDMLTSQDKLDLLIKQMSVVSVQLGVNVVNDPKPTSSVMANTPRRPPTYAKMVTTT